MSNGSKEQGQESGKDIAYYSAILNARISTNMERDKAILTLSSAGIGLIVTLLTTVGVSNLLNAFLLASAIIAFLAAIWFAIIIFEFNGDYLDADLDEDEPRRRLEQRRLRKIDRCIKWSFVVGALLLISAGITSAYDQSLNQNAMSDKEPEKRTIKTVPDSNNTDQKSLGGVTNHNPKKKPPSDSSTVSNSGSGGSANSNGGGDSSDNSDE